MSLVVGIALVIAALVGVGARLSLRRQWAPPAAAALAFAGSLAWFLHPVCVAIPPEDLAGFTPPIEVRTDTDMIGERVFQQRDGSWFQCKPWIARALFF
jgi:hypothetical protein